MRYPSKMVIEIQGSETRIDIGGYRISARVKGTDEGFGIFFQDPFKAEPEADEQYPDYTEALLAAMEKLTARAKGAGIDVEGLPQ